jgi:PRTRC genetic system protein C
MPIKSKALVRVFKQDATVIADPAPHSSPQDALKVLAITYPRFNNAAVDGPFFDGGKEVWQIKIATGTKG